MISWLNRSSYWPSGHLSFMNWPSLEMVSLVRTLLWDHSGLLSGQWRLRFTVFWCFLTLTCALLEPLFEWEWYILLLHNIKDSVWSALLLAWSNESNIKVVILDGIVTWDGFYNIHLLLSCIQKICCQFLYKEGFAGITVWYFGINHMEIAETWSMCHRRNLFLYSFFQYYSRSM